MWQPQGQPFQRPSEDVVYLGAVTVDDPYNKIRYPTWFQAQLAKIVQYVRIWKVIWTVYGPNSFDNARLIHSYIMTDDATRYSCQAFNLFLIPNPQSPVRVPEYKDNEWWERVDFAARFYELVTEQYTAGFITNAEVIVQDESGVVAEIEIEGA
jgi:hypothetical protein